MKLPRGYDWQSRWVYEGETRERRFLKAAVSKESIKIFDARRLMFDEKPLIEFLFRTKQGQPKRVTVEHLFKVLEIIREKFA